MTHATRAGSGWALLPYGEDVTFQGVTASYATVMLWSDAEREAFGVFTVPEPGSAPEGQMEASRLLVDKDGRPSWAVTYQPAPPPVLPSLPSITDRQFGCGLWDEKIITFEDCEAFVSVGTIPAPLMVLVNTLADDTTGEPTPRKDAILFIKGAKEYHFDHPLVDLVRELRGWTVAYLRARWAVWATL